VRLDDRFDRRVGNEALSVESFLDRGEHMTVRPHGVVLPALGFALIVGLVALHPDPYADLTSPVLAAEGDEGPFGPAEPEEWLLAQRTAFDDSIPAKAYQRAAEQASELAEGTAEEDPVLAQTPWELEGPTNIGGRVVDIAVDPVLADTVYMAAATGGVWKSTDAGSTFAPAWPHDLTQSMGALAIASDGTLFAGTGEPNNGGGSIVYGGSGVYRSTDRGETWQLVGLETSGSIGRIAIDPTNPDRIFVAAKGYVTKTGGQRGLWRSNDGGDTWQLVLSGENVTTGAADVAIDPARPNRVFVAMWDTIREPDLRTYGGVGSGLFRSTDGGSTWTRLGGGLPAASASVGRIGVAIAPSETNRVYATVITSLGAFEGFYTSLDGGDTWVKVPADTTLSGSQSSFGWWFGRVWVDPTNPLHVFVAGVPMIESFLGGVGWLSIAGLHADQHAMAWDARVAGRVYLGNDGGFYRGAPGATGVRTAFTKATYQPITQFYSVDVGEQDPSRLVGGTQDNGCLRSFAGADWNSFGCGDGLQTLINPENQDVYYGCSQYGSCTRIGGGGFGATTSQRRNWYTPLEFDPTDPSVMYYGGNILNRSANGGGAWTAISPDLTGGPGRDTQYPYGTLTSVQAAASDPDVLYVGTDDGRIWTTKDLGQSWTRAEDPDFPQAWVTRVAIDPNDEDVAYATFSGYRAGSQAAHVFRTGDGGTTWDDISGDLPNAPVSDIKVIGDQIVVATDVGVFLTRDLGASWLSVGAGMPLAPIIDLRYHAPTETLYAANFGRGIYRIPL
jgi:photosystem II stability/assembly factor-like uncharacterized protein